MPTISVVICAHSEARFSVLVDAMASVENQGAHEVILVIDNNKSLFEKVKSTFLNAKCIENTRTKGLSGARNSGTISASGSIVAFLDDDAIASARWLESISLKFQSQFVVGAGGPIDAVWPKARPVWFPAEFDWVVGCTYEGLSVASGKVRNLIGCNMAFRRSALLMAGMFSEGLGRVGSNAAGAEETELCLRLGNLFPMSHIAHDPNIVVKHQIEAGRTAFGYFAKRCWAEGKSKSLMVGYSGTRSGLASERKQLFNVLPKSIWNYLKTAIVRKEIAGVYKAVATVTGTALVVASYLAGRLTSAGAKVESSNFFPTRVCDIDLGERQKTISACGQNSLLQYSSAYCVVRHGGRLLTATDIPMYGEDITPEKLSQIFDELLPKTSGEIDRTPKFAPTELPFVKTRVVVATRNRPEMLSKCLDSLLKQDHPNFEIVVVDNAPDNDATKHMLSEKYAKFECVSYVLEPQPGLANAHNRGLVDLDAQIVAFTDDDVIADPNWLTKLTRPFLEDNGVGCVTGGIVPAELETRAQVWTEKHGAFLKSIKPVVFDLAEHRPENRLFPYAAGMMGSGANMAFSAAALAKIGGFEGALGAGTMARGGDDLAAFASTVLAGYRVSYVPDALVWHFHRRSEQGMKNQAFNYGVGLGAYLTNCVVNNPKSLIKLFSELPAAASHMLGKNSSKNSRLPADYPAQFIWSERLGVFAGIPFYFKSVWASAASSRNLINKKALTSAWEET